MNDDCTDLENELRALQPRGVGEQLEHRIGKLLGHPSSSGRGVCWWQRLGFNRPSAAFGWGLVSPILTAVAVFVGTQVAGIDRPPALPATRPSVTADEGATNGAVSSVNPLSWNEEGGTVHAANVVYRTLDEGVVLDGEQEPVHRVRYHSADLVQWRNPNTGARWEVSYPREDVRLVPVRAD